MNQSAARLGWCRPVLPSAEATASATLGARKWVQLTSAKGEGVRRAIQWLKQTSRRFRRIPMRERLWLGRNKFQASSYALYQFAGKDARARSNYLSDGQAPTVLHRVNAKAPAEFLRKQTGVSPGSSRKQQSESRYPTLRGVIRRQRLTAAKPPYRVTSFEAILKDTEAVVVKPIGGFRGRGVHFVTNQGRGYRSRHRQTDSCGRRRQGIDEITHCRSDRAGSTTVQRFRPSPQIRFASFACGGL